jgi:glycosyltransferase involved in cell wall biosynthesis
MIKFKKGLRVIKNNGVINGISIIRNKMSKSSYNIINNSPKKDLFKFYEYIYFKKRKEKHTFYNNEKITILWFIPDFGIGSGGHLNIFRMIFNLSKLGIKSDIAICGCSQWVTSKIAKETIYKHFFELDSNIIILDSKDNIDVLNKYSIAMATSWQTAYYVNYFNNCCKKTYFVQDYEPYFYSHGSNYIFAENTYRFGFTGISAGSWISNKLKNDFNMECESFSFSYDRDLYFKHKKREEKKRVFFYARPPTDRRAFELGLLALNEVTNLNPDVEVVFAGWDVSEFKIDFKHFNSGIVSVNELSNLYSQCDCALVLSFTNLSLLPIELLASGCPVVSNSGLNNSWIDKDKKLFVYAENNIEDIVKKVDDLLNKRIHIDFEYINEFLKDSSWEKESKIVKKYLSTILNNNKS